MPLNITVVNIKTSAQHRDASRVYIGRAGYGYPGSPLASPFHVSERCSRNEVMERYQRWLVEGICANNPAIVGELRRIRDMAGLGVVELACWCKPERCHGDIVKYAVENWI